MEVYLQDLILERDNVDKLHEKIVSLLEKLIKGFADIGADGIFFCEDWGLQDRLLVSPQIWREVFKPVYTRLCKAAHDSGLQVIMHSCGYNWEILDDLALAGVDCFQFDQPELYGLERLSKKLKDLKVCLFSPVDIQKIMPTGNKDLIVTEANKMIDLFHNTGVGFIAKNYIDLKGIGVNPEWDMWAYEAFLESVKI
jgi:uroporphyrinogen-III decarboxylase